MLILYFVLFALINIGAYYFLKLASLKPAYKVPLFIAGNVLGITGTWFLILTYRAMNVNVALAIAGGSTFISTQIAMAIIFKTKVNFFQWAGIFLIAAGLFLVSYFSMS